MLSLKLMEELKRRVAAFQSRPFIAPTVRLDFYTSSVGQHYAILVTQGLWRKVRLFVEDQHPNCPRLPINEILSNLGGVKTEAEELTTCEDQLGLKSVDKVIEDYGKFFNNPDFYVARRIMVESGYPFIFFIREVPKCYASNPDKYLTRGDIIATPFVKVFKHTGIYLGNGQVGHMSGHGGGKTAGVARIGRLIGDFVETGSDKIWIVCLPLRIRRGEDIATKAEEFAANKFRDGEYNILLRNCQHFAFLCATGEEYSMDKLLPDNPSLLLPRPVVSPLIPNRNPVLDAILPGNSIFPQSSPLSSLFSRFM